MAVLTNIPDMDIDFISVDGFVSSLASLAPYVEDYCVGELTRGKVNRLSAPKVRNNYYHTFEIPKKSGGTRKITAPGGDLKKLLKVVAYALKDLYSFVPSSVMGFVDGCSVATNAAAHTGRSYVLNIDLKDFFPSIKRKMVVSSLVQLHAEPEVARLIARLCTLTPGDGGVDCLPQGSPASPILSNIVCLNLDYRLSGLAQRMGLTYTRYADDITFSSDYNVYQEDGSFWKILRKVISECGFTFNDKKTRLKRPWERQEVTGVTVNTKCNVSRKYLKNLRAELHQMQHREVSMKEWTRVMGKVNYVRMVRNAGDPLGDYRWRCLLSDALYVHSNIKYNQLFGFD